MQRGGENTVVVLGGGYAGVRAALDLDKQLPEEWRILLIDKSDEHHVHALLYEVATMVLDSGSRDEYEHERHNALIPYEEIFHETRVEFVQGEITNLSFEKDEVSVKLSEAHHGLVVGMPGERVRVAFEYIVVALGSETNYFDIPGIERAYGLKSATEALNIRSAVCEAISASNGEDVHVVIGGGGFTAVELAGELMGMVRSLAKKEGVDPARVHVTIIEGMDSVLPHASSWIKETATKRLKELGVTIVTNARIEEYAREQVYISGERILPANVLVWTAGVRGNSVIERMNNMSLQKKCIIIDQYLRVEGRAGVYAAGDNIYCVYDSEEHEPVPATAQRAVDTGRLVASNIAREIAGKALVKYSPKRPIWFIPIGGKFAIVDTGRVRLKGVFAWFLKMCLQLWYLSTTVSWGHAFSLWQRSMRTYIRND